LGDSEMLTLHNKNIWRILSMNREQRRKQKKEQRRVNSKKNFISSDVQMVSLNQIVHDDNLKECDPELVDLMSKSYRWDITHEIAFNIINFGLSYMDSLCALRFDITPIEDKVLIRDTMGHISNMANWFMGNCINGDKWSISEKVNEAHKNGVENVTVTMPKGAVHYDFTPLPENDAIEGMYAGFVVKHAHELVPYLVYAKLSDIGSDRKHVFDILEFITKKTKELMLEAQVESTKYIVEM